MKMVPVVIGLVAATLGGCTVLDEHIEQRAVTYNSATNAARNDGILLNILRAAHSEPFNFIAVSKVTGGQSSDGKLGLPTITLGAAQSAAQKQWVFSSSTWDNTASVSFDSAPQENTAFYSGMMSSVDLQAVNGLIGEGLSRELVFDAAIDAIEVDTPEAILNFRNDPFAARHPDAKSGITCPIPSGFYGDSGTDGPNPYAPDLTNPLIRICEYREFEYFLQQALKWGFTVQTVNATNTDATPAATAKAKAAGQAAPPATIMKSRFCFDLGLAEQSLVDTPSKLAKVQAQIKGSDCTEPWKTSADDEKEKKQLTVQFKKADGSLTPPFNIVIKLRSPIGIFRYIGHILRSQDVDPVQLYWADNSIGVGGAQPVQLITVSDREIGDCFAKARYLGKTYCVPAERTDATKEVFMLLAQLVALNTAPGSLPTTIDVRLQ